MFILPTKHYLLQGQVSNHQKSALNLIQLTVTKKDMVILVSLKS